MTVDPVPFLFTIITTSAALVAIIGGLLVTRFISLDSDQRTSRKALTSARERLDADCAEFLRIYLYIDRLGACTCLV